MKQICENCGQVHDEVWMMTVFTGRVHWICWDCYKKGHGEAAAVEIKHRAKKEKEWNK